MIRTIATVATGVLLGAGVMLAAPGHADGTHTSNGQHIRVQMRQFTVDFNGTVECVTAERHRAVGGTWSTWHIPFATQGACAAPVS